MRPLSAKAWAFSARKISNQRFHFQRGTGHGAPAWLCGERRRTLALGLSGGRSHSGLERSPHRRHQCVGPSHRLSSEVLPALGEQVQQVALELSIAFGYSPARVPQPADQQA